MGFYDATCGSQSLSLVGAPAITDVPNSGPAEVWNPQSQTFVAPVDALSVSIDLEVVQQLAQTNVTANFDTLDFHLLALPAAPLIPALSKVGALCSLACWPLRGILAVRTRPH